MEEEEEGRPSDTEDGENATDGVTAHLDTTMNSASQSPIVIDIQAVSA